MISAMWVIYVKAEVAKCSVVDWTRIVPKGQSVTPNERNAEVKGTLCKDLYSFVTYQSRIEFCFNRSTVRQFQRVPLQGSEAQQGKVSERILCDAEWWEMQLPFALPAWTDMLKGYL